jgi:opacity protein-like surface antigen
MKTYKFLTITIAISFVTLFSETVSAQITAGGGLSISTETETLGLTINGSYPIQEIENFRVTGDIVWYFPKQITTFYDQRWFEVNLNANYTFYEKDEVNAYSISGLNFTRVALKYTGPNGNAFSNTSDLKVGLNLGVGGEYRINDQIKAFAEFRFVLSNFDQAAFSAGVRLPIPL